MRIREYRAIAQVAPHLNPGSLYPPATYAQRYTSEKMNTKIYWIIFAVFGILPFEINGFYKSQVASNPKYFWYEEIIVWIIIPSIIYLLGINRVFSNENIGFTRKICGNKNETKFIILIVLVSIILSVSYTYSFALSKSLFDVNYLAIKISYEKIIPCCGYERVLVLIWLSLTGGIIEEFYYRGLIYKLCKEKAIGYVLISSLIFSSVHWEGGIRNLFSTFIFGFICSIIYVRYRNLWPLIIGHITTDLVWFSKF